MRFRICERHHLLSADWLNLDATRSAILRRTSTWSVDQKCLSAVPACGAIHKPYNAQTVDLRIFKVWLLTRHCYSITTRIEDFEADSFFIYLFVTTILSHHLYYYNTYEWKCGAIHKLCNAPIVNLRTFKMGLLTCFNDKSKNDSPLRGARPKLASYSDSPSPKLHSTHLLVRTGVIYPRTMQRIDSELAHL